MQDILWLHCRLTAGKMTQSWNVLLCVSLVACAPGRADARQGRRAAPGCCVYGACGARAILCDWLLLQDRVSTIRSLCIGISAHQKLEHLSSLVTLLGYESLAVFGDCFDEARPFPAPNWEAVMLGWSSSACAALDQSP